MSRRDKAFDIHHALVRLILFKHINMPASKVPLPLLSEGEPVDWFFAFKFNSATFPGGAVNGKVPKFGDPDKGDVGDTGIFGGTFKSYKIVKDSLGNQVTDAKGEPQKVNIRHGQQYAVASSKHPVLTKNNTECIGTTLKDPLGATFAQVYDSNDCNYLIWNDQFYGDPDDGMGKPGENKNGKRVWENRDIPWGHSKGMLAWNNDGDGFVLQVSTPSWPASGSRSHPRKTDGNTLGCVTDDDVEVSQHFFCLKINAADLEIILNALKNASVVTAPNDLQIVRNGGPANIQVLVSQLGVLSPSKEMTIATLSSGVKIISKPSLLNCPPWQLVSAKLGGLPLRVASWWGAPEIYSTNDKTEIKCWPSEGVGKAGAVEIALSGTWDDQSIGLRGKPTTTGNHAKIGVSTDKTKPYAIFGDMNQMGALSEIKDPLHNNELSCNIHQNGRGGLFFVVDNKDLFSSVTGLLQGLTASLADQ